MKIDIILFGQLVELIGKDSISLEGCVDSDTLLKTLKEQYPMLATTKFVMAIDKEIVNANRLLADKNIVALLPPFSGG